MARSTVCLNMIVRDEAHVVEESLRCALPHIDSWVIVDTGSADGTPELIESFFAEHDIPGHLHRRPWHDFAHNRTEALALCRGVANYAWVLDADDIVEGDLDLGGLTADSYLLRFGPGVVYWRRQVFRTALPWRFEGVIHEYPVCDEPAGEQRLPGDYFVVSRRLGARSRVADKYERDAQLLRAELDRDPGNERASFYLAQSLMDAGDLRAAADEYGRRAEMGGWGEEVFIALLRRAECLDRLEESTSAVRDAYLAAHEARPARAEPLHALARRHRAAEQFSRAYERAAEAAELPFPKCDSLFVDAGVYEWGCLDEMAIAAFHLGRHRESFELVTRLIDEGRVPPSERPRIRDNRDHAARALADAAIDYPETAVRRLSAPGRRPAPGTAVTLTITTCRRPQLFERTFNSFINSCLDIDRIGRFICVDDGSHERDLRRARELYPFLELVTKDEAQRGHAASMNLLLEMVDTPLWLHLEDDWQFFAPLEYIGRAEAILAADERIGQVVFNRNYGETLEHRDLAGGHPRRTADGIGFHVHEYLDPETTDFERFMADLAPGEMTSAFWPHYSLQPSLGRTEAIRAAGRFDPDTSSFEHDFASRYAASGHVTAFFDAINSLHIGRLRGEQSDRPNAYDLNRQAQHGRAPRAAPAGAALSHLVPTMAVAEIALDVSPPWPATAGTLAPDGEGLALVVRTEKPGGGADPRDYVMRLDSDLEVQGVEALRPADAAGLWDEGDPPSVAVPDGRLAVVAEGGRTAAAPLHRFVLLDESGRRTQGSEPLALAPGGFARCGGLVRHRSELLLAFAIEGRGVWLAVCDAEQVWGLLKPVEDSGPAGPLGRAPTLPPS